MRVLFPFTGETVGGSHLSALTLIEVLPAHGVEPVVALHGRGRLAGYLADRGVPFLDIDGASPVSARSLPGQLGAMAAAAPGLARFLRRQRIDVVHTNDARMHVTWGGACRLAGLPLVWHQRSADDSRRLALFARGARAVVTISEHCRRHVAAGLGCRARVVYDPFETDVPPPDRAAAGRRLRDELAVPAETAVVGFVGNLTEQKRPLVFVDAAARLLAAKGMAAVFPMIGEMRAGQADLVRARIAETACGDACRLLGPRHPIDPWIAGFDVLVAPAVNEGLGRTLVEAALAGTPVVAVDDGGHPEVVHDGVSGRLVPRDDPGAVAAAVHQVLRDPAAAARYAAAARNHVRARFAARQHVETMLDIYRSVM